MSIDIDLSRNVDISKFVYIKKQTQFLTTLEERTQRGLDAQAAQDRSEANTIRGRVEGFLTGGMPEENTVRDPTGNIAGTRADDAIVLSATKDYSRTETGTTTDHPVDDNQSISDHYQTNGSVLNFSGVIGPKVLLAIAAGDAGDSIPKPQDYLNTVKEFFKSATDNLVEIHFPDGHGARNCVLTSFKFERNKEYSNGYLITIAAKQIQVATGAITKAAVQSVSDTTDGKGRVNNASGSQFPTLEIDDQGFASPIDDSLSARIAETIANVPELSGQIAGAVVDAVKGFLGK